MLFFAVLFSRRHGRNTFFSSEVREALQLKADGGAFRVENFDPEKDGVLEQVRYESVTDTVSYTSSFIYYALN